MKKNKFAMIKGLEKHNNDFDVKKTHRQIIDDDHYFKSKEFIEIEIQQNKINLIHQCLIKALDDFIYFEIVYNNEFLFDARLSETLKKDINNIFIFIIETNAINLIIIKLQINFETQKYNEDLTFITNTINFKIANEIIFERYKVFIIIKINEN